MNKLTVIKGVECYIDQNGIVQLSLESVAKGLGFTQNKNGVEYLRWDRVEQYLVEVGFPTSGERPQYISEPIFYLLAMKANNDTAKQFQRIVAYEILPAIRKHGLYATEELLNDPDLAIKAFTALKEEREKNKLLVAKVEQDKPKVEFFDQVASSKDAIEIGAVARVLNIGIGRNKLFEILRQKEILMKNNLPYQKYIDAEYFRTIEQKYTRSNGDTNINIKTLVYQKGLNYIRNLVQKG
jgi:phage antirepressor YoqD-like protein